MVIRILVVGEEALVRTALHKLLDTWNGFITVGEAATLDQAVRLMLAAYPDVILVSLTGQQDEHLEAIRQLSQAAMPTPVLALIGECDERFHLELLRGGVRRLVEKTRPPGALRQALQDVCTAVRDEAVRQGHPRYERPALKSMSHRRSS